MVDLVKIENYKSIKDLVFTLGRINILIGENGSGKTNILESLGLFSAAYENKLDNEFLISRGIRVSTPLLMKSAFRKSSTKKEIKIGVSINENLFLCILENDNKPYSKWKSAIPIAPAQEILDYIQKLIEDKKISKDENLTFDLFKEIHFKNTNLDLKNFAIYSPENSSLRTFEKEVQFEPLGIHGEGLLKLIKIYILNNKEKLLSIKKEIAWIDWFEDFDITANLLESEDSMIIKDRYIDKKLPPLNQKSVNEGFLFLLFYITLFISEETPRFFAIDNIEASLNPKLCTELMKKIVELSKKYDKQVIITTHNPAVLDGLNLNDKEQKLFVVSRNKSGHTTIQEIGKPNIPKGEEPVKLSEAFLNGMLGGLPKNF
jgi:predicted ATPase